MGEQRGARGGGSRLDPAVARAAAILVIGSVTPLLDSTMVNVAVQSISDDFSTTMSAVQWVITGYMLAMGVATSVSGWASRRFGGRRTYVFSLAAFLAGSVLAGLSWDVASLVAFRVVQGLAAGLMVPVTLNLLVQVSGGRQLGRLMSYMSIPSALGPVLGPVLGGVIVSGPGWRWIFYVNVPIALVAIVLALRGLPRDEAADRGETLDWAGLSLLAPALAALIYGISRIGSGGADAGSVLVPLALGVVLAVAFVAHALLTRRVPVVELRLFRIRGFAVCSVLFFLSGLVINGSMLLFPLYYQQVHGASALYAGLLLVPQSLGMLVTQGWFGRLTDRIGPRRIVLASLGLTALGTLPFVGAGEGTSQVLLAGALLVRGAGLGGLYIPVMASAYDGIDERHVPDASTVTRILQTIGGAFGPALLTTVIQARLAASQTLGAAQAQVGAYGAAFLWSIAFAAAAVVPALLLPSGSRPDRKGPDSRPGARDEALP